MSRRVVALAAATLLWLAGCHADPDAFPFGITSLAVLPAEVIPTDQLAGRLVGDHLTRALEDQTRFRVVGIDSTSRILAQPDGIMLFERFRNQVASGVLEGPIARTMGARMGVQGLLLPRLALALSGPVMGQMSLTVSAYEATEGQRVWQGYSERGFSGHPGEPAFNLTLGQLVNDIMTQLPRPAGEVEE